MNNATLRGTCVAHIIQYFQVGGLERMVLSLVRHHRQHGMRCVVLAYAGDGEMRVAFSDAGAEPVWVENTSRRWSPSLSSQITHALRPHDVDIIHTHHLGPFIHGAAAAKRLGASHIHTEHSHEFYDATRRKLIGALMPWAAHVTCVSREISSWRQAQWGVPCEVIPNGVAIPDVDQQQATSERVRQELGIDPMNLIIGCVARLSEEKGHKTLLRGVAQLHRTIDRGLSLIIVGDGPERASLEALSSSMGLDGVTHFLGRREDVDQLYPAFDLVALTSHREGLPLALLEAMSHARPVIASAVGGIPDLLVDGGGILIPPRNPQRVADAIATYAQDHVRRKQDGLRARFIIKTQYSAAVMGHRYLQIYAAALGARYRGAC